MLITFPFFSLASYQNTNYFEDEKWHGLGMQFYKIDNPKHKSQIAMTTIVTTVSRSYDVVQISCWRQVQPMEKRGSSIFWRDTRYGIVG